ncbi:MAG: hypothetical protein KDA59_15780, partial [Planctomycetales bacterium]|nr:hypothetical protein [Planctomycetales bacterium]MCA9227521.1 hypothetical protein [Planctomycetales bacterium]
LLCQLSYAGNGCIPPRAKRKTSYYTDIPMARKANAANFPARFFEGNEQAARGSRGLVFFAKKGPEIR